MKTGTVAIMGRSNVGKSTLMNRLVREKIAIVSDKPQTTRMRTLGVAHVRDGQIAFLDTPGLHKPQHLLNRRMLRTALDTMDDADVIYVLGDATTFPGAGDHFVIEQIGQVLRKWPRPVLLILNKIDLVKKPKLLPLIGQYAKLFSWTEIVPVSAQTGLNVDRLLDLTVPLLPEGERRYDEETVTDQSMRTLAAEMIREKILQQTYEEIPHSVAVEIDDFVEEGSLATIRASVLVEKDSQKSILIGKQGNRLKAVGTAARLDMERLFGLKVFLELWVKVRPAWREDDAALAALGY